MQWAESLSAANDRPTMFALAFGKGLFVAVGDSTSVMASDDGLSWAEQESGSTQTLYGVASAPGTYVAVGGQIILTSADARVWRHTQVAGTTLYAVAHGNGRWVAVGTAGRILTSADAVTWSEVSVATTRDLNCVAFGNDRFVAISGFDESLTDVLVSTDGCHWTLSPAALNWPNSLSFCGNAFVAGGDGGSYFTSAAGLTVTNNPSLHSRLAPPGVYIKRSQNTGRMICVQGSYPWVAAIYPLHPLAMSGMTSPAAFPTNYLEMLGGLAPMSPPAVDHLSIMAGAQPLPSSTRPRVFTSTTAAGTIRTCLVPDGIQYRTGDRFEVLRSQRTPDGALFYLVVRNGCAGWIPAEHLAISRRRRMRELDDGGEATDTGAEDWEIDISDGENPETVG